MNNKTQFESVLIEPRSGLVPFIKDTDGQYRYLLMISSNPRYGGPRPMVSKGKIEEHETAFEAAVREAEEELGFKQSNAAGKSFMIADQEHVHLRSTNYKLTMYAVPVLSKYNFGPWCDETKCTVWLTLREFKDRGRHDHYTFLQRIEERVKHEEAF